MAPKGMVILTLLAALLAALLAGCGQDRPPAPREGSGGKDGIGIILLHGKGANGIPPGVRDLAQVLRTHGYRVVTPEMAWSAARHYDVDYPHALAEIAAIAQDLRAQGAVRLVIAGHSLGANAAIAYAGSGRPVAAIVALAPGHTPDLSLFASKVEDSLGRARDLVAQGRGGTVADFTDLNQGQLSTIRTSPCNYRSYFEPQGLAAMPLAISRLPQPTPLLWVVGSGDPLASRGSAYAFDLAPRHPCSRFLVVPGGHRDTPSLCAEEVAAWLASSLGVPP